MDEIYNLLKICLNLERVWSEILWTWKDRVLKKMFYV